MPLNRPGIRCRWTIPDAATIRMLGVYTGRQGDKAPIDPDTLDEAAVL